MRAAAKRLNADPEFRARNAAAVKANWQDPEFRAKQAAATKANWQDPEFRAYMSRCWARHCVRAAGLPLTRANVDRAKALLVDGDGLEVVIDALICDARGEVT